MPGDLSQLQRSPRDVAALRGAQQHLSAGRYGLALSSYRELTGRFPLVAELWFELGRAGEGEQDFELANQVYRKAMEMAPGNTSLMLLIGHQFQGMRQADDARDCFERAVASNPTSVDARISLAMWCEKENQLDQAKIEVEMCLAQHPQDDQARYFRALLLHRQKQNTAAETTLRDLIKSDPRYPYVKYSSRHLLGVVLDELGQYPEALRWLLEAKALVRQLTDVALLERDYDHLVAGRRRMLASLTPEMILRWQQETIPESSPQSIAFLGGHPRSGTTLLEQILDAHPALRAFDESNAFNHQVAAKLPLSSGPGKFQARSLNEQASSRLEQARQGYRKHLLRTIAGDVNAGVLLDKNPSLTVLLPQWLRVFPQLKVLIALRDPRDVVLSCFFLNPVLNATNMNFLSVERTARHYENLMDVWLRMRELGGFAWREVRYEEIVENLEVEGRKATEFLGLQWDVAQNSFHETARRKFLFAPTHHEVRQPLYRRAVGRWKNYVEALEHIQPKLAPYCRALGYPI
jgi:tetratricopeptide (TPR) repeat protein